MLGPEEEVRPVSIKTSKRDWIGRTVPRRRSLIDPDTRFRNCVNRE